MFPLVLLLLIPAEKGEGDIPIGYSLHTDPSICGFPQNAGVTDEMEILQIIVGKTLRRGAATPLLLLRLEHACCC